MSFTSLDLQQVVSRHLGPGSAGIVVYRPESSPRLASSASEIVGLLEKDRPEPLDRLPPRDHPAPPREAHPPSLEREEAGVSVFMTAHGTPILVRPKPGSAFAYIGLQAIGGVRDEPNGHSGITTLAIRTSVKGTSTRTAAQLAEDSEMLGGSVGTTVGAESFGWSISVPVQHLEPAVELLADVVHDAVIPDDALETERTVALADLAALRDDMFRFPMRLVMSSAFEGHPYAMSPLGTQESLQRLTLEDVRQWYRGKLLTSRFVIGVVGDVVPSDVAGVLARELGMLRPARASRVDPPSWPVRETVRSESRDKAQTALALAFPGPSRTDPRRFASRLTSTIASGLGGRFFDELRDRQSLAYTVHAYTSEHELAGMFLSYIATSPEKEDIAREGLLREFERFRSDPVTEGELERAKRYTIGSHAIRQESGAAILSDMLDAWMFGSGLNELLEHDDRVRAVSADEILSLAGEFFDPARRVEGIVRGEGKIV